MTGAVDRQGRVGIGRGRDRGVSQNGNIPMQQSTKKYYQAPPLQSGLSQPNDAVVLEGKLFDWVKREGEKVPWDPGSRAEANVGMLASWRMDRTTSRRKSSTGTFRTSTTLKSTTMNRWGGRCRRPRRRSGQRYKELAVLASTR